MSQTPTKGPFAQSPKNGNFVHRIRDGLPYEPCFRIYPWRDATEEDASKVAATCVEALNIHHETKQTPRQILESREALREQLQMAAAMVANLAADYEHGKRIHPPTIIEGLRRSQASYEKALTLAKEGGQT